MSAGGASESILKKVEKEEGEYAWLKAAESYRQLLDHTSASSDAAAIWKKIGHCYRRASRQAIDLADFRKFALLSVEAYHKSADLFSEEEDPTQKSSSLECKAAAHYVNSWLASDNSKRREALDECLKLGSSCLEALDASGEKPGSGAICSGMLLALIDKTYMATDANELRTTLQQSQSLADRAISIFSERGEKKNLVHAYSLASLQSWYSANFSDQRARRKELMQRSMDFSRKALELSEKVEDSYYAAMSNWAAAFSTLFFTQKAESSLNYANQMLRHGMALKDNFIKGVASYVLTLATYWMTLKEADPDKRKEGYRRIFTYAEDAGRYLALVSHDCFIAETYSYYAESYSSLAREVEGSPGERQTLLEKAIDIGRKGLDHATVAGSSDAEGAVLHALSKALDTLAHLELVDRDQKGKLLEEALGHRREYNRIVETVFPFSEWTRGVGKNYEGLIKAELAKIETDTEKKKELLQSAITDLEDCLTRCRKFILTRPVPTYISAVGRFEDWYGGTLDKLFALTNDSKLLRKAVDAYENSASKFVKVALSSRAAESYWKMAKVHDRLGKHQKAAEGFEAAFKTYKEAAQKIPDFADFYLDYATYMKAWSEIEGAKHAHRAGTYAVAMKRYESTAALLRSSELWGYLSTNFHAWSLLEQAEDLSRSEASQESIEAFEKAGEVFKEAKEVFEGKIEEIHNRDEKEKAVELSRASIRRREYCLARIELETAKVYDRKGEHAESSEKYDSAADILEKILGMAQTEAERKEIEPIAHMCRAWEKMKLADGRASPELYSEAANLFAKVTETSAQNRTTLLASGNSAFCKALEYGSRFEATRERQEFSKAKNYLESASNYYLKAGFDNASLWTSATEILFDAFNYMITAEVENDPEEKMKAFLLAEKCLEKSAQLFDNAGYTGKKGEVLRTLTKVKEKREFALSLGELLSRPNEASATNMISAPALNIEEPVGLLKFEQAFIQGNLIVKQREVVVGDKLELEIQLANLGKNLAFLIKVDEIVPKGFDLVEKPVKSVLSEQTLNLKGKRLPPLETAEMKLVLKPKKKGSYSFTPKVEFMDETGEHKSCELEQVSIEVKELGIRGWLRGPW